MTANANQTNFFKAEDLILSQIIQELNRAVLPKLYLLANVAKENTKSIVEKITEILRHFQEYTSIFHDLLHFFSTH